MNIEVGKKYQNKLTRTIVTVLKNREVAGKVKILHFVDYQTQYGDFADTPRESFLNTFTEYTAPVKEQYETIPEVVSEEGTRDNTGKLDWSLVDFEALEPMVKVLEFGAKKYERDNWKKGGKLFTSLSILNSLMRHVFALVSGETHDLESGLPHIGHIMCNAMFWSRLIGMKSND